MKDERFRVGYDDGGGHMYFEVRVFDTLAGMRRHYGRSRILGVGHFPGFGDDALAFCSPRTEWLVDSDKNVVRVEPRIGFILLNREHLEPYIVVHELVHAALTYYRERGRDSVWRSADFGESATEDEEAFAYIFHNLWIAMNRQLHDRGLWT